MEKIVAIKFKIANGLSQEKNSLSLFFQMNAEKEKHLLSWLSPLNYNKKLKRKNKIRKKLKMMS